MEQVRDHFELGIEAFKNGDISTAIEELESATRENPANFKAFNFLGAAYAARERYNAAIGAFKAAERINPNVASIHYNIGQAYEAAGIPEEAQYEYQIALQLDPGYTKASQALDSLLRRLRKQA